MKASDSTILNERTKRPLSLTRMGFGGAPLGNLYRRLSDEDAQSTLDAAYRAGIRYFDTAPQYGLGRSESRIGAAMTTINRNTITLSTKVGRLLLNCEPHEVTSAAFVDVPQKRIVYDYSYDGVMRSYEASLVRLGVEQIDILFVHDIDVFTHGNQSTVNTKLRELFNNGGYRALQKLKDGGRVLAIGAGVNEWQVCERLLSLGDFDGFLLAGRYTLLEQSALDHFLPLCCKRDVGIILGGPYNSGILATGAISGAKYNYADAPPHILQRVQAIERVCVAHSVKLIAASLQFVLGHPAVKTVIPGAMSAAEVRENVALMAHPIPDGLWFDLKSAGLLREDAPVPTAAQL